MPKGYKDIEGDGGSGIVTQVTDQMARLEQRMARVRHTVAVLSGKGGVGKSVTTANIASLLAERGRRVGALDVDFSGPSLARMLGAHGQQLKMAPEGIIPAEGNLGLKVMSLDLLLPGDESPVTWNGPAGNAAVWQGAMEATVLRELLSDTEWGELDYLLLDLPSGTEKLPSVAGLLPELGGAVIVTIPSEISYFVVKKAATQVKEMGMPVLGLVENMSGYVCPDCGAVGPLFVSSSPGEETAESLGVPFLGRVPFDPRLSECTDRGTPFILEHRDSPVTAALEEIAGKIEALLEEAGR